MAKPSIERALTDKQVVQYIDAVRPYFNPRWHFHPEYQISLILKGKGMRFIGDHVQRFEEGDLVFTGPNLPHLWRSDAVYFETGNKLETRGVVLYFDPKLINNLLGMGETFHALDKLVEKAERGMRILGDSRRDMEEHLLGFEGEEGFQRVVRLMGLLEQLAECNEYELLAGPGYKNAFRGGDADKMRIVHDYVMTNFQKGISVAEISGKLCMSPSSFCRYFKPRAHKTFTQFVNDVRIGHAKQLLLEDNLSVSQISYECGFNSLSNFNKQFKAVVHLRPSEYKKLFVTLNGKMSNRKRRKGINQITNQF